MANFNFNKVIIGGRISREPEMRQTQSGVSVLTFSVAVNRKVSDGEMKADFITCVAWRNTAEFIYKYFQKGASICLVGKLETRTWDDNNGNKRYATEVIVDEVSFVDSKGEAQTQNTSVSPTEATETQFVDLPDDGELPF